MRKPTKILHESDFNGMKILVSEVPNKDVNKTVIILEYGYWLVQSSMFKDDPDKLQWIYAQNMVKSMAFGGIRTPLDLESHRSMI